MPRADTSGWRDAVLGATLLATVAFVWRTLVFPTEPASTPIRLVDAPVLRAASPAELGSTSGTTAPVVHLMFAGDIMQHRRQAHDDFRATYAGIAPLIARSDLAIANLEFPVDGTRPVGPAPGSTTFNGSGRHLDAIAAAGFDLLQTANNHALDQGPAGTARTWAEVRARGMDPVGTAPTLEQLRQHPIVVREVHGLRIGFIAYSFTPNRFPDPTSGRMSWPARDMPLFALNFRDWSNEYRRDGLALFREHVRLARAQRVDLLVALVHWGDEWHLQPSEDQRRAGHDLVDAGFDLVVGGHSHVLNPPEVYRGHLIAYSLGDLVADFRPLEPRIGALLEVTVGRDVDDSTRVTDFRWHPTLVGRDGHRVQLLHSKGTGEELQAWRFAKDRLGPGVSPP